MTNQPRWRLVANLGDVNPVEYGGFFVYRDTTKVYGPEVELLEAGDSDADGWTIYRACIESDPTKEWWYDKISDVARFIGQPEDEVRADLASGDVVRVAHIYQGLMSYFGGHEFDSYPIVCAKRSDLPRRIRRYNGKR